MLVVVLGRELFMTFFRQAAARRGVVIAAIGPAKWKTGFQWIWVGAAYFWFFAATLAASRRLGRRRCVARVRELQRHRRRGRDDGAVVLTLYSLGLYLRRYASVFPRTGPRPS